MVPGYKMSAHFVTLFFYVRKKFTDINVGSLHDIRVSFHVLARAAHSQHSRKIIVNDRIIFMMLMI